MVEEKMFYLRILKQAYEQAYAHKTLTVYKFR